MRSKREVAANALGASASTLMILANDIQNGKGPDDIAFGDATIREAIRLEAESIRDRTARLVEEMEA